MSLAADRRRALLAAALGFLRLPLAIPPVAALHAWLDNWCGIGHVIIGMECLGYESR